MIQTSKRRIRHEPLRPTQSLMAVSGFRPAGSVLLSCLALSCTAVVAGPERTSGSAAAGAAGSAGSDGGSTFATGGASGDPSAAGSGGSGSELAVVVPGAPTVPRLTVAQYQNAIARLFGSKVTVPALESDDQPDFFSVIGAARQPVTESAVSLYWEAAKSVAQQVTDSDTLRSSLLQCATAPAVTAACITSFLDGTGTRLFRRPLSTEERARYTTLIHGTAEGNLWQGVRFALTAMLASPSFLYREERTIPDASVPGGFAFDDYALGSRLSFLTINDGPDDQLLQEAAAGSLHDPAQLMRDLDRLYPKAISAGLTDFFDEYLGLGASGLLDFEGSTPAGDRVIAEAMRGEAVALAQDAIQPNVDFRQLFTTRRTYLNGPLATLYGVPGVTGAALVQVSFPESSHRGGLLTTGAFLTIDSASDRTKPTNRGFFVQSRLLCTQVPDPPDNIPELAATGSDPAATSVRKVLELHRVSPSCSACHSLMDPIGLGMEDFDQFGRYRTAYSDGSPVDASSEWNGVPVTGAAQLGAQLATDPKVAACITKQLFRYTMARREDPQGEAAVLSQVTQRFVGSAYRFQELLRALVASDSFRHASAQAEVAP